MGALINLRRFKKAAARAAKDTISATNRLVHGAPKHLRKIAKAEDVRAGRIADAHKLESKKPSS